MPPLISLCGGRRPLEHPGLDTDPSTPCLEVCTVEAVVVDYTGAPPLGSTHRHICAHIDIRSCIHLLMLYCASVGRVTLLGQVSVFRGTPCPPPRVLLLFSGEEVSLVEDKTLKDLASPSSMCSEPTAPFLTPWDEANRARGFSVQLPNSPQTFSTYWSLLSGVEVSSPSLFSCAPPCRPLDPLDALLEGDLACGEGGGGSAHIGGVWRTEVLTAAGPRIVPLAALSRCADFV